MTTPVKPPIARAELLTTSIAAPARGGLSEVASLAYPVVLTQISITLMQVVDSAMVGRLGATELAAVGFGGVWMWTAMCFFIGLTTAVQTFVSQRDGAGDPAGCGSWAWQGIYLVAPLTTCATLALWLGAGPLVALLGPSPELQPLAVDYVSARALGAVGLSLAVALSSFFRGVGDTRTPLYATIAANLFNAVLDYGLIFGRLGLPELGVQGAGLATAAAEWVYLLALWIAFRRRSVSQIYHTERVAPVFDSIRRLARTGIPIGGQWWLEMASFAGFITLVARMGDASMAASQVFVVLLSLSFMQAIGLSIAVSTLVGRYIGADDLAAVERSFRSGLKLCLLLAGIIGLLFIALPGPLLRVFSDDPAVLELGRPLLLIGALFQAFDALAILADGALRGAGDTRRPLLIRFTLAWGLFLPLAYLLGVTLEGGLTWAWAGGVVYVVALSAMLLARFRSRAWQAIRI